MNKCGEGLVCLRSSSCFTKPCGLFSLALSPSGRKRVPDPSLPARIRTAAPLCCQPPFTTNPIGCLLWQKGLNSQSQSTRFCLAQRPFTIWPSLPAALAPLGALPVLGACCVCYRFLAGWSFCSDCALGSSLLRRVWKPSSALATVP